MITGALKYGALFAKIRSMHGKLMKPQEFEELSKQPDVPAAIEYISSHTAYGEYLRGHIGSLHREDFEKLLRNSILKDYLKIKKYVKQADEQVLRAVICRYETTFLKNVIRGCVSGYKASAAPSPEMIEVAEFDAENVSRAEDISALMKTLEGTPYKEPIASLYQRGRNPNLFEIETSLDIYYFRRIWKTVNKYAGNSGIKNIIAQEADILNLLWIYRCKKYYSISNEVIYALMLPVHGTLNPAKIKELIESADFDRAANDIKYYDLIKNTGMANYEKELMHILVRLFGKINRAQPYGLPCALEYIFAKRLELENIFSLIEGIRYGLESEKIMEYAVM